MPAIRCWEFQRCGREKECPAYPTRRFDCWNVAGTLCRGQRQSAYDQKVSDCRNHCPFYEGVMLGSIRITDD
jgi:hypothetical protein